MPPAAERQVDFHTDVLPILAGSCAKCHAGGKSEGGFRFDDRTALLEGGDTGEAIVPGDSAQSALIHLVAGAEPDRMMPAQGRR